MRFVIVTVCCPPRRSPEPVGSTRQSGQWPEPVPCSIDDAPPSDDLKVLEKMTTLPMKATALVVLALIVTTSAHSQPVTAHVTDSVGGPTPEGILNGYFVQVGGEDICRNPYVIGRYITCQDHVKVGSRTISAQNHQQVWFNTNGYAEGMAVIGLDGGELCTGPRVNVQFRGPDSFITC